MAGQTAFQVPVNAETVAAFADLNARHDRQVAAGLHDAGCEWRHHGHWLCNCAARTRIATGYTQAPGPLVDLDADGGACPRCDQQAVFNGDAFECAPCHAIWFDPFGPASFSDDHGEFDMAGWDDRYGRHPSA